MTNVARLLADLIALPSVNSAFLPARHPDAGEKQVAEHLAALARRAGLEVSLQKVLPGRPNVLVRLCPSGKSRRRVVLAPHLDTVNVVEAAQFTPTRRGGRLYGRGACDTKGSAAAMFAALCEVTRGRSRPRETEILFVGLVDEECGQAGSRHFAAQGIEANLALVGEPTALQVATAHKGNVWLELQTTGRAAHGSTPWFGKNAIHSMSRVVQAIEVDYARQLKQERRHSLLGFGTVNVGRIHGGLQPNIVPASCSIEVDRRTLPGQSESQVRRELQAFLRRRKLPVRLASAKVHPCPAMETKPNLPLVRELFRYAGQKRAVGLNYFCDAAVLAAGGIPSVVFGPGDIAQAHTADEWISLSQLEQGKLILQRFLKSLP